MTPIPAILDLWLEQIGSYAAKVQPQLQDRRKVRRSSTRYPGRAAADAFIAAVDRASHAWAAAAQAAERLRTAQFAPGERTLLEQTAALLALARQTPHEGQRLAAYGRAAQHLAELKRRCGWVMPQQVSAVLSSEARRALRPAA